MANQTYLPTRDSELKDFAKNMNTKIAPDPTLWGLTVAQHTAFDTLVGTFILALETLQDPLTQSTPYVTAKNDARNLLINSENGIRKLVDIIQAYPGTTNTMRSEINITIRDTTPTPIAPPSTKPELTIMSVDDNTVYLRLRDFMQPDRRGRPEGAAGAYILSWVGETPPNNFGEWKFEKKINRTSGSVTFPDTVQPLSKVWLAATWVNATGETGPYSTARWANVGGGVAAEAA